METDGCGITAISIILSGYGKNITPEDLRKKYYPVLNGDRISSVLSDTYGIDNSDFLYDSSSLSNETIQSHLEKDKPILICVLKCFILLSSASPTRGSSKEILLR